MLPDMFIKKEPLDLHNDLQSIALKNSILKQPLSGSRVKEITVKYMELEASYKENFGNTASENLHIVDEQPDLITVKAGGLKYEDESQLIQLIQQQQKECIKEQTPGEQLMDCNKYNSGTFEQRCSACSLTFFNTSSLLQHLNLHRENYFFCNRRCGVSFKSIFECQQHEKDKHPSKYEDAKDIELLPGSTCSFCRECFKTELGLHVHWLNKKEYCGNMMQEVVSQFNEVVASNAQNEMTNQSLSIVPITKLRLKTSTDTDTLPNSYNKRLFTDDDEMESKRLKLQNIAAPVIKEEPLDDTIEQTLTPDSIIPEIVMKTEPEDDAVEKENENKNNNKVGNNSNTLFDIYTDLKKKPMVNTQTTPTTPTTATTPTIPPIANVQNVKLINNVIPLQCTETMATSATNIQLIKLADGGTNMPPLQLIPLQTKQNTDHLKTFPIKLKNVQIFKLPPNTRLVKLPVIQVPTVNANNVPIQQTPPFIFKIQNAVQFGTNSCNIMTTATTTSTTTSTSTSTSTNTLGTYYINSQDPPPLIYNANRKSQITFQLESVNKTEDTRKNFVISKDRLKVIESLPEKKQIIDNMIRQIKQVENNQQSANMMEEIKQVENNQPSANMMEGIIQVENDQPSANMMVEIIQVENNQPSAIVTEAEKKPIFKPSPIYVPLSSTTDLELIEARRRNKDFHYRLLCPYCRKQYEVKTFLRMHLLKAHNLTDNDLNNMCIQAMPFTGKVRRYKIVKKNIENELPKLNQNNVTPSNMEFKPKQRIRYRCDKCGRFCSSKTTLKDHILTNCSREPLYACNECPKKFFSAGTLQCHTTIHTGELPHKCSYCDKRFRTRGQLTVHHRIHTGERPFVCQVCSLGFTHRETLISHLSRHIGMKRYKCYGCDKLFSCISALKTHRDRRLDTCGKVKFNARAIGPRIRVVRGSVIFEAQPEINPYLRSEDPQAVLDEIQQNEQNPL